MQYKRSNVQSLVKVEGREVFYDFFLMSKSLKENTQKSPSWAYEKST